MRSHPRPDPVVDILGIGFGPSNLALAIAVTEHNESTAMTPLTVEFLERKPQFQWHRGMLLDGATMQVAFLKDLVTLRNPVSRFGFVPYLHAKDRLIDFINHKSLFPSRIEFHDYLAWCAEQMRHVVSYGVEVVSCRPVEQDGLVNHYEVVARDVATGETLVRQARNLVVAPGLTPRMPATIAPGPRVWHSSTFLDNLARLDVDSGPQRFVVVGAGQSAAEVTDHLHRSFPGAEVYAVFSRFGYSQSDDSPYANRIFDPATVDVFHRAPEEVRTALLRYHANTNYSVVDVDLIESLYRRAYEEKVQGVERLHFFNVSQPTGVRETDDAVEVTVRHADSGRQSVVRAAALVCATGYRATDPRTVLGEVAPLLWTDEQDRLLVERDYRVVTGPEVLAGVYLCGGTENTHGITSSLLSNTAVRAGEILAAVLKRLDYDSTTRPQPANEADPARN
ncbi:lysine N(6)-hydroxylase/L-ornithine N(5)-oxygenase family protein [Micromonospora echinofusca]|uniref:L-lysine N6-monooxygenase MbtG n=1 Tax=Micromonospora echinofusca TaxID=47858 RepID=A0ABS3W0T0_MICEH|nr:SidA/IucD/PvdA family monooxygenase [Micromonospora echinofusca]MBO4210384.1 SidA/IucD/PvdA family monooxygenase [Micromonospora echinofusca]